MFCKHGLIKLVYILKSLKHHRYYTGVSTNVNQRLHFHNQGLNTSTRSGAPWELIWASDLITQSEALTLEKKIKKRGAARFLADLAED